jgi:hypothetical protein
LLVGFQVLRSGECILIPPPRTMNTLKGGHQTEPLLFGVHPSGCSERAQPWWWYQDTPRSGERSFQVPQNDGEVLKPLTPALSPLVPRGEREKALHPSTRAPRLSCLKPPPTRSADILVRSTVRIFRGVGTFRRLASFARCCGQECPRSAYRHLEPWWKCRDAPFAQRRFTSKLT